MIYKNNIQIYRTIEIVNIKLCGYNLLRLFSLYKLIFIALSILYCNLSYAHENLSQSVAKTSIKTNMDLNKDINIQNNNKTNNINIESDLSNKNLANIDDNANDLMQLKRTLEIKKTQAELKKIKDGMLRQSAGQGSLQTHDLTYNSPQNSIENILRHTIVTSVAINQQGRKIAWLRFPDNTTLEVVIGTNIGAFGDVSMNNNVAGYIVDEISMDCVVVRARIPIKRRNKKTSAIRYKNKYLFSFQPTFVTNCANGPYVKTTSSPHFKFNVLT